MAIGTLNCIREVDYASLTETTPWYIFVPGLIAAAGGTYIIVRLGGGGSPPTDKHSGTVDLTDEPVEEI